MLAMLTLERASRIPAKLAYIDRARFIEFEVCQCEVNIFCAHLGLDLDVRIWLLLGSFLEGIANDGGVLRMLVDCVAVLGWLIDISVVGAYGGYLGGISLLSQQERYVDRVRLYLFDGRCRQ